GVPYDGGSASQDSQPSQQYGTTSSAPLPAVTTGGDGKGGGNAAANVNASAPYGNNGGSNQAGGGVSGFGGGIEKGDLARVLANDGSGMPL
ncbi:hypothetical protein ABLW43_23210, partial [Salmonella enterica]